MPNPRRALASESSPSESKVHRVLGIQVYGRKGYDGHINDLDAIDTDEAKIREIAHRLQQRGFGVMRRREVRAGRTYYLLKATWSGSGVPPDRPFKTS
jgi:hypothetical protein